MSSDQSFSEGEYVFDLDATWGNSRLMQVCKTDREDATGLVVTAPGVEPIPLAEYPGNLRSHSLINALNSTAPPVNLDHYIAIRERAFTLLYRKV